MSVVFAAGDTPEGRKLTFSRSRCIIAGCWRALTALADQYAKLRSTAREQIATV